MNNQQASQIRTGLVLITIGAVFLLAEFQGWRLAVFHIWPWSLVLLGTALLVVRGSDQRTSGAWWLVFTGGVFLLHSYRVASIRDTWPLFVVATGVSVMMSGIGRRQPGKER